MNRNIYLGFDIDQEQAYQVLQNQHFSLNQAINSLQIKKNGKE